MREMTPAIAYAAFGLIMYPIGKTFGADSVMWWVVGIPVLVICLGLMGSGIWLTITEHRRKK